MHILFFTDNFPPEVNAAATRVFERARYWVQWGHQVTIITSAPNFPEGEVYAGYKNKWYQVESMSGMRVVRVKTFIAANKGFLLRILDFVSYILPGLVAGLIQKKPDVIACTSPQFFVSVTAWVASVFRRKPFVFEVSDLWPESIKAVGAMGDSVIIRLLEKLELFLYRRAKSVVLLTESFKVNLIERGINSEKLYVILNGVEMSQYSPREKNIDLVKKYDLKNHLVVGYIGNHGPAQDLGRFLNIISYIKLDKVKFLFVGSGADKERLLLQAQEKSLNNVIFIDKVLKNDIANYWSVFDVALVSLKQHEAFKKVIPSKIFEIMGMGLPIFYVGPEGDASQLIANAEAGLVCADKKDEDIASELMALLEDKSRRVELAKKSFSASYLYGRDKQAEKYLEVLLSSLGD